MSLLLLLENPIGPVRSFHTNVPVITNINVTGVYCLGPISINDNSVATPYPSTVSISGITGTIVKATVSIQSFTHPYSQDVGFLLVSPLGKKVYLANHMIPNNQCNNISFTFDDAGIPPIVSGYLDGARLTPGYDGVAGYTSFMSPAPGTPYVGNLSTVNGDDPNGNWSLYVQDDAVGDEGSIGSWCLDLIINENLPLVSGVPCPPLYLYGKAPQSSGVALSVPNILGVYNKSLNLYINNVDFRTSTIPLSIYGFASLTGQAPLYIKGQKQISTKANLFIKAWTNISGTRPLYIYGIHNKSSALNMYMNGGIPFAYSGILPLNIYGLPVGRSGLYATRPLYIFGSGRTATLNLFLAGEISAKKVNNMNLYTGGGAYSAYKSTTMFVQNNLSGLTANKTLFIQGSGTGAGAHMQEGVMNLYLHKNWIGNSVPLTIVAPTTSSNSVSLYVRGAQVQTGSVNLSIPKTVGQPSKTAPLFTHGFG
jgi:subtilisin-like proprotein convertase family protein